MSRSDGQAWIELRSLLSAHGEFLLPEPPLPSCGSRHTYTLLWKADACPLYVIDNHLLAYWCWRQHCQPTDPYALLHWDAHWDAAWDLYDDAEWRSQLPDPAITSPADFHRQACRARRHASMPSRQLVGLEWDNYLSLMLAECPNFERITLRASQDPKLYWREPPSSPATLHARLQTRTLSPDTLASDWTNDLDVLLSVPALRIVNLDMDLYRFDEAETEVRSVPMTLAPLLRAHLPKLACVTVAMSPATCGGLAAACALTRELLEGLLNSRD